MSKNCLENRMLLIRAGELEGAAARLKWNDIPRSPYIARVVESRARAFPLRQRDAVC